MSENITRAELIEALRAAEKRISELERAQESRSEAANLKKAASMESALHKSRSLLAEVQQIGHIGHIEWSGKGKQLSCSDEMYEILGVPYGTIIDQHTIANMMDPNERKRLKEEDRQAFSHRRDIDYTYRIRRADGNERWLHQHGKIAYDEQGAPIHMMAVFQDITEHKQAEEKLHQRLTELEVLYTSGLILNRLSSPQKIGEKVIELLEQKMNWHHSAIRLYDPVDRSLSLLAFSQPMLVDEQEHQKVKELLEKSVTKSDDGLSGWVVRNNQAIRVNNVSEDSRYRESYAGMSSGLYVPISLGKKVIGVISIESEKPNGFSESDERFVATLSNQAAVAIENARLNNDLERRVRERTAEVQNLYDNAPAGYHSLDSKGCFTQVNQTELNWLGYSREELMGHPVTEFLTERSIAIFQENFPAFKKNGWLRDLELEFVHKNGSTMPSLVNAIAIYDARGNYTTSRTTLFNNTERKKIEIALRESQFNLQSFLDTASDLIQSLDENGHYLYVNNAWCETLGYTSEEALQLSMFDVVDPIHHEHCR